MAHLGRAALGARIFVGIGIDGERIGQISIVRNPGKLERLDGLTLPEYSNAPRDGFTRSEK